MIINEKGNVVAAVIGVGGFLGIGEKNVAVPFDALEFRTVDPAENRSATRETKKRNKSAMPRRPASIPNTLTCTSC